MSLFIGLLAFAGTPALESETKIGVLAGSLACILAGAVVLRLAPRHRAPASRVSQTERASAGP